MKINETGEEGGKYPEKETGAKITDQCSQTCTKRGVDIL